MSTIDSREVNGGEETEIAVQSQEGRRQGIKLASGFRGLAEVNNTALSSEWVANAGQS